MKLLIIAPKRSGKDHLAEYLRDSIGLTYESSSRLAAKIFIFDKLKDKYGYQNVEECFLDRSSHRPEWYELIREYNKEDPIRLCKEILKNNDAYIGMRSYIEADFTKQYYGDELLTIFVDSEGRTEPESESSCTISKDLADIIIDNKTTVVEFEKRLHKLSKLLEPHIGK